MEINTRWSATGVVFKETPFERIRDNYHGVGNFRFHIIFQLLYTYIYIYIFLARDAFVKNKSGGGSLGIDVGLKRTEGRKRNGELHVSATN